MSNIKKVAVYGVGGTGINLLNMLMKFNRTGLAEVIPAYVDTSSSNLLDELHPDNCYLIEGCDGGGKDRKLNYDLISRSIPAILIKHPPEDLNIIVLSGGGASGSVIGPKIAEELWRQGRAVVFFLIGSRENGTTTTNTVNTWASLNGLAKSTNSLAVVCYDDNLKMSTSDEVDERTVVSMAALLDLYSGHHERLDSTDVHNFVKPKVDPQVALLDIHESYEDACAVPYPVSVASIHGNRAEQTPAIPAEYGCEGYRRSAGPSLHYAIYTQGLKPIIESLIKDQTEYKALTESRRKMTTNILDRQSNIEQDGMCL